MKALVLYDSQTGNTEKVAKRIHEAMVSAGHESDCVKVKKNTVLDLYAYDLLFVGSPVIAWGPTNSMKNFVLEKFRAYTKTHIDHSAPLRPGKFAVSFCTYAGSHIGELEAVPLTKWFSAFTGHLGYQNMGEWHIVGEFHNQEEINTRGRLGDIRGRPNANDLLEVENRVKGLLPALSAWNS